MFLKKSLLCCLGYVHTWHLFWSCRLFYIIILWSKPCFQNKSWALFKTPPPASFSAAQSVFQVEKSSTFLKKKTPYVKRLFDSWPMTSEWRVVSITTKTTRKKEKIAGGQIVLVSEHKELYEAVHHPTGAPGLNCWKHHTVSFPV